VLIGGEAVYVHNAACVCVCVYTCMGICKGTCMFKSIYVYIFLDTRGVCVEGGGCILLLYISLCMCECVEG